MARQDKDKGFHEKLKNFFKIHKGQGLTRSRSDEIVLTDELQTELKQGTPLPIRVKAIKELAECAKTGRLESYTVEKLWELLEDLLMVKPDVPKEIRHQVIGLFTSICRNYIDKSQSTIRSNFFAFIQTHHVADDAGARFELLKALTDNGREMQDFNEKIGPFLLTCMPNSQNGLVNTKDFMSFVVNVIKFTQSFLDPDVLEGIVRDVCFICCTSNVRDDLIECLNVLSAVICYPSLPPTSLPTVLATLCRTVNLNVDNLCQSSWKIMRDLLGTHLGNSGLLYMCQFMETGDHSEEVAVIRGAVFFVGTFLWGNKTIRSLKYSPSTVLSSFSQALERKEPHISFEVIMRIQDLIRNQGDTFLSSVSWDLVLDIVDKVIAYSKHGSSASGEEFQYLKLTKCVNETLDLIQKNIDNGTFSGSLERFYNVVDASIKFRPENSVEKLLQYKVSKLLQATRPGWFNNLVAFAERHYKLETRGGLKVYTLSYISNICLANRDTHEEDLIDKVILPNIKSLETEIDMAVRQQGVKFIVEYLMDSNSKKGHELLQILDKIVNRPYEVANSDAEHVHIFNEKNVADVSAAVQGLIRIFQTKMYRLPSSIPIAAYKTLVKHLTAHYKKPSILEDCYTIRYLIYEFFFKIRANSKFHLGYASLVLGNNSVTYSAYLAVVDYRTVEESGSETPVIGNTGGSSPQPSGGPVNPTPVVTSISLKPACKLVVAGLRKEKDWRVLQLILKQIPFVMENKALILSSHANDIDILAEALFAMMQDKTEYPESLRNRPQTLQKTEFQACLYPILTALVSYHENLESAQQNRIVKYLERGLVSRSAQMCIIALATCALEMKETMHKLLPEVLLSLSKITPKVNIAIPVLEFLSTLIHLPRVFASFVQDQYMSIFAIALPYTNPFKFSQYTVSLAHHVIAMWFLKCRLSFRRGFVSYIIKGLQNNVLNPCEEEKRRNAEMLNEDSSSRKRSSSLTEQSNKRGRERPISGTVGQVPSPRTPLQDGLLAFHQELTETCVDLMARYAFSDSSALPTQFPSTTFLLRGGHSQTWLMDNRIITITASGCTQKELREGLCDKCFLLCRKPSPALSNPGTDGTDGNIKSPDAVDSGNRRRHRSEYATSKTGEDTTDVVDGVGTKAKDDLHLELEHKLQPSGRKLSFADDENDWAPKPKSDHMLCTCWCQGWSEIYIRRPTGNTSWMMRIQNQIGNNALDLPIRELSAMYLPNQDLGNPPNSTLSPSYTPPANPPSSNHSSTNSSPNHRNNSNEDTEDTPASINSNHADVRGSPTKSHSSPSSPQSPTTRSPAEERKAIRIENMKQVVHRSNSSPEMESWKYTFVNQQHQIQEQDEEELAKINDVFEKGNETQASINTYTKSSGYLAKGGTTSPYRGSYEAIPEEVIQKDIPVQTVPPTASISPSRFHYTTQHSVEEPRSRPGAREKAAEELVPLNRDRVNTVSVMTGQLAVRNNKIRRFNSTGGADGMKLNRREYDSRSGNNEPSSIRSGISPSFVFLQLCHQGFFGKDARPLMVTGTHENSIKVLDYIPPYETHKIGVVYVGPGQAKDEGAILQNMYGSTRYRDFLQGLGKLVKLGEVDHQKTFLGGLSKTGEDGDFAYIWQDDVMQVMFHVSTLMPNKPNDLQCNAKKRHIGNDFLAIVYNNSNEEYDIGTFTGQFLYACVVIQPLDHGTNRIIVKAKPVLADQIGHTEPKIVSDKNLPTMARQLALHSNLASLIFDSSQRKGAGPYASNWLERLRKIKQLKTRLVSDSGGGSTGSASDSPEVNNSSPKEKQQPFNVVDFTDFV